MADRLLAAIPREATAAIAAKLKAALADPTERAILLTREEGLLALGLVEGLAELLEQEAGRANNEHGAA